MFGNVLCLILFVPFIVCGDPFFLAEVRPKGGVGCVPLEQDDVEVVILYPFTGNMSCFCLYRQAGIPCTAVYHVSEEEALFEPCADRPTCVAGGCPLSAAAMSMSYGSCDASNVSVHAIFENSELPWDEVHPHYVDYWFSSTGENCTDLHYISANVDALCDDLFVWQCGEFAGADRRHACANVSNMITTVEAWDEDGVHNSTNSTGGDDPGSIVTSGALGAGVGLVMMWVVWLMNV